VQTIFSFSPGITPTEFDKDILITALMLNTPLAKKLITNPVQRNLAARAGINVTLRDSIQILACAAYLVGTVQLNPCGRCANGLGKFVECVVYAADIFGGACSHCYYGHRSTDCSYHRKSPLTIILRTSPSANLLYSKISMSLSEKRSSAIRSSWIT